MEYNILKIELGRNELFWVDNDCEVLQMSYKKKRRIGLKINLNKTKLIRNVSKKKKKIC